MRHSWQISRDHHVVISQRSLRGICGTQIGHDALRGEIGSRFRSFSTIWLLFSSGGIPRKSYEIPYMNSPTAWQRKQRIFENFLVTFRFSTSDRWLVRSDFNVFSTWILSSGSSFLHHSEIIINIDRKIQCFTKIADISYIYRRYILHISQVYQYT